LIGSLLAFLDPSAQLAMNMLEVIAWGIIGMGLGSLVQAKRGGQLQPTAAEKSSRRWLYVAVWLLVGLLAGTVAIVWFDTSGNELVGVVVIVSACLLVGNQLRVQAAKLLARRETRSKS
jgi:hypothetical protein